MEEDSEHYQADVGYDEVEFDIEGDPNHTSGMVHLEPNNELAEDANPDGVEVEFEVRCSPGDPNGDETGDQSVGEPDDVDDEAETDDETLADEDEAVHPADLDIDPADGWAEPHDGVEIPDEPGRAVLMVDGERFELEGGCNPGGEVHAEDEDEQRELRAEHGHFTSFSGFHTDGGELSAYISRVLGIGRIAGISDRSRTVEEFDQFALGNEDSGASYQFLAYADGEPELVEDDGVTEADEPFVRVDPSGVITAVGKLERVESGIDPEVEEAPIGEFEFGARCHDAWTERYEDGS
ncbi:hypothetical protein CV102_16910 [Natronococcus pandeyae]|uniref:Uncharacterized protein n=2 Tax=Natronococcus pandeyae TaxID=2055836 RepID=A0A8J8Q0Y6_9EURY|nr:hypothetical protein CV102_16910 [Natronococcus pandeyae]